MNPKKISFFLFLTPIILLGQSNSELNTTCSVLYQLTDKAIDNDRKDLVALYYNAYKAIRENGFTSVGCDTYFDDIKSNYLTDIGFWTLTLDFPPKRISGNFNGNFTHKEVETLRKINELNLTVEDLTRFSIFKELIENNVDLGTLKTTNVEDLRLIEQNLMNLQLEKIDFNSLNKLPNNRLKIEEYKKIISEIQN